MLLIRDIFLITHHGHDRNEWLERKPIEDITDQRGMWH